MFTDEKIERLKLKFAKADFSIPFAKATGILKKIEKKFIKVKDISKELNNIRQHHNHWANNMKNRTEINLPFSIGPEKWLQYLDSNTNYWTIIPWDGSPAAKHFVYDCKPAAIEALYKITNSGFFIACKKYSWLLHFEPGTNSDDLKIYKSGAAPDPF